MAIPKPKSRNRIDRNKILEEIVQLIENSPDNEAEISSSELANRFGVQPPTMDYHLNVLVNNGHLILSPKRGRYNRKIYRLPEKQQDPYSKIYTPNQPEKFQELINEHLENVKKQRENNQEKTESQSSVFSDVLKTKAETTNKESEAKEEMEDSIIQEQEEQKSFSDLTLDEQIEQFLNEAQSVHHAETLLEHEDKEILSVMNETIHQTQVYLKDLSEQLSTVQNKQLIQGLIDDRNRLQEQIKTLEEELKEARQQVSKTSEKYDIDPQRVRSMQQMIIATIDDYVNRPNHAMALQRREFRSKVFKEVNDLAKYALKLED